jgi:hypothetical protein
MSSREAGGSGSTSEALLKALDEARSASEELKGKSVGLQERPALRRAYLEIEHSVFLLRMAASDEEAPPYDSSLDRLDREELISRMARGLDAARRLAGKDPHEALRQARIARDCAASAIHSLNLELRKKKR